MVALVSLKSAAAIIPCTVARYRISFAISRMAFVLPPACGPDKTIFTPVILHLEREKSRKKKCISTPCAVRHISQILTMHSVASCCVFQMSCARYSLRSRAKRATMEWKDGRKKQNVLCFVSSLSAA